MVPVESIPVGTSRVGDGEPVVIVLEAGPTHGGEDGALKILESASAAGVQAVKFQLFDPDDVMADRHAKFSYEVLLDEESGETELVEEPLYEILLRRVLPEESWRSIAYRASELHLDLFFTVASRQDVEFACSLGATSLKIASGDLTYHALIEDAAATGLPVQLDSGGGSEWEVARALEWIRRVPQSSPAIVHHCPKGYPAQPGDTRLKAIRELKSRFGLPVGFSDHSPGWDMDIAAIALGANLIEKNVSNDRLTRDVEHLQAIAVADLTRFVASVRDVELAVRDGLEGDRSANPLIRRGAYLAEDGALGSPVASLSFKYQRPCIGLEPWEIREHAARRLIRPLKAGEPLRWSDLGD